jgi:hypothetical protein
MPRTTGATFRTVTRTEPTSTRPLASSTVTVTSNSPSSR